MRNKPRPAGDAPFAVPDWPASRGTVMVKVGTITPHPKNPRIHPDGQINDLGASFDEFGVVEPPVVDENFRLMAGEGRWLTAKKKNYEELPCIVVSGWSEAKKLRFMIASNRLQELASYDDGAYRAALALIKEDGGALGAIGFNAESLAAIVDGWNSNINVRDKFGANTDGIGGRITIEIGNKDDVEQARTKIAAALKRAKIVCEIR